MHLHLSAHPQALRRGQITAIDCPVPLPWPDETIHVVIVVLLRLEPARLRRGCSRKLGLTPVVLLFAEQASPELAFGH
jgi:hypothetical protein